MYHLRSIREFDLSLDKELPLANTYGLVKDGFLWREKSKDVILIFLFSPVTPFYSEFVSFHPTADPVLLMSNGHLIGSCRGGCWGRDEKEWATCIGLIKSISSASWFLLQNQWFTLAAPITWPWIELLYSMLTVLWDARNFSYHAYWITCSFVFSILIACMPLLVYGLAKLSVDYCLE